jgi:hypothetical protein
VGGGREKRVAQRSRVLNARIRAKASFLRLVLCWKKLHLLAHEKRAGEGEPGMEKPARKLLQ